MHKTNRQPANIHTVNADFIAGAMILCAVMIAFMGYMLPNWTPDGREAPWISIMLYVAAVGAVGFALFLRAQIKKVQRSGKSGVIQR